jgi:hypothetical protein
MTPEHQVSETRMAQTIQGGEEVDPEYIGERVAHGIEDEKFLILQDEVHAELIRRRAADLDSFLSQRFEK